VNAWVRPAASAAERRQAQVLLGAEGLPRAGLDDSTTALFIADVEGEVAGCAAIEQYGDIVMLRSVATRPDQRGRGVAAALCAEALAEATRRGARTAYLLTTTAEPYFARLGFRTIPRAEADPRLSRSAEWGEICRTAALMTRSLTP
jgi:amino-acid N-acetyltransferase